jgi:hypothetical protein
VAEKFIDALTNVIAENHIEVEAGDSEHSHYIVRRVKGEPSRFLKIGDKVQSADLDDFKNEGFNVKETVKK